MMLMKSDEATEAGAMPDVGIVAAMGAFNDEMARAGILRAGEGLHASAKGARLRAAGGKLSVTDGPFAEARELIAGYWIIEVGSLDEAKEWAARCPMGSDEAAAAGVVGQIEIRQINQEGDIQVSEEDAAWRERLEEREAASAGEADAATAPPPAAPGDAPPMRFLMTFKADEKTEADIPPSAQLLREMGSLMAEMARSGVLLDGEGLRPSTKAARVNFSGGRRTVTDGPFTETRELIAGYSIIGVRSKDEAIDWAGRAVLIDADGRGGESEVDLRQIFGADDFPPEVVAALPDVFEADERLRDRAMK